MSLSQPCFVDREKFERVRMDSSLFEVAATGLEP